jgi:hypothetical protein
VSPGERDAEPAGEEHAAREHDVEDLEPREEEEGGELGSFSGCFSPWTVLAQSIVRRLMGGLWRPFCLEVND